MASEVEVAKTPPTSTAVSTTYDWLSSLPMASSTGNAVYSLYESSKNCCRVSKYALGTVECSVKYAAETAAPLVKKLDRPIQAVDAFAVRQLVKLEEKVPAIKKQPSEVLEMIQDSKAAVCTKLSDGKQAICTKLSDGKQAITTKLTDGKQAICSRISDGKQALSSRLSDGKDAVVTRLQAGSEVLANTRAGILVGQGVNRTLSATESLVDYLLPPEENEKELISESEKTEKELSSQTMQQVSEAPAEGEDEEEEEEEEGEGESEPDPGRITRIKRLSRKVKLRVYYRSLRRLNSTQQNVKSTLEELRIAVAMLKLAQSAREGVGKQYQQAQTALKDLDAHVRAMWSRGKQSKEEEGIGLLTEESQEGEEDIQWLPVKQNKGVLQGSLDSAKALSERLFGAVKSVASAATYLPHQLKGGAAQVYSQAQELCTTLKSAKVPTDLPASALNRISELVDTQIGYCRQLGSYITSTLKRKPVPQPQEEAELASSTTSEDSDSEESSDEEEEDPMDDPSHSQPPGQEESEGDSSN